MSKIYILNAPPNSGKDTLGDYLVKEHGWHKEQMKTPLFTIAAAMLGLTLEQFVLLYSSREWKESYNPVVKMTIRELMIKISEDFVKPVVGKEAFGILAAKQISCLPLDSTVVFSDGGFVEEIKPLVDMFGKENVVIVRIHRKGCNFENDSRKYITDQEADELGVNIHDFYNDEQPLPDLFVDFEHFIDFLDEKIQIVVDTSFHLS